MNAGPGKTKSATPISRTVAPTTETITRLTILTLLSLRRRFIHDVGPIDCLLRQRGSIVITSSATASVDRCSAAKKLLEIVATALCRRAVGNAPSASTQRGGYNARKPALQLSSALRKRSRNGICVGFIFWRAIASVKNSARSTSGNILCLPERGGHSSSNRFDLHSNSSGKSPSNAQPCTVLPPFCIIEPSSI